MPSTTLPDPDLVAIPFNPQSFDLNLHDSLPQMDIPVDNPLTVEGVELGRHLFYDPILSLDSTKSCNSCHLLSGAFTDNLPVSEGVDGAMGRRSSMSLLNIGFAYNGLFWDGRSPSLEDQALHPVEDNLELKEDWDNVENKFRDHIDYPAMFRKAFGIESRSEITRDLAAKALAQFQRTLVNFGSSKYDKVIYKLQLGAEFTEAETDGFLMFTDRGQNVDLPDAECDHCHSSATPFFTIDEYRNNGLDEVISLNDYPDKGRGEVTGKITDNGKFRVPTLRNIALTGPYMHDGRFETLEEVIDHYNEGTHPAPNVETSIVRDLGLTSQQKTSLVKFLHTLTDTSYLQNPAFDNPFEE